MGMKKTVVIVISIIVVYVVGFISAYLTSNYYPDVLYNKQVAQNAASTAGAGVHSNRMKAQYAKYNNMMGKRSVRVQ